MSQLNQTTESPKSTSEAIDLTNVLDILLENRLLILAVTVLFALAGVLYVLLAPPVFETNIVVQVEDSPDSAAKGLLGDLSSMFDVKSTSDAEIQIIGSRLVVSRAVNDLGLHITAEPKRFPLLGGWLSRHAKTLSVPGILGVGGFTWGTEAIDVGQFDVPSDFYEHKYQLRMLDGGRYVIDGDGIEMPATGKVGELLTFSTTAGPAALLVRSIEARTGAVFC